MARAGDRYVVRVVVVMVMMMVAQYSVIREMLVLVLDLRGSACQEIDI